ncbi:Alpha/beta hydrolase family protein [Marinomonas gallaica]|uniref:Alpha/beta hydrolase family protein n=2 Tax=Marinomonas gallaica TaxID=1806667 RepID=A0A1C3JPE7_9GAMM|nr:Alpha/beta hydrolase family protein [Marinomonas gallaica]SBT20615.1 Alpha/beta hydrolase family protein [Marinomonas gallaica]
MRRAKRWILFMTFCVMLGLSVALFLGLNDFDVSDDTVLNLSFTSNQNVLAGSLILPEHISKPPIAIIVHGDGAQTRFSDDSYLPMVNHLLKQGIGVFSWDKPGVGESTGDWLQQSMQDRSDEVIAAYNKIHSLPALKGSPIGFLGFSQAGWVLPIVTNEMTPAFTVIVGGAVNWRHQGAYFTKRQLEAQGLSSEQVAYQVADNLTRNDAIFASSDTLNPSLRPDMNPKRFAFVARNYASDATPYLGTMQGPVLALWGADDQNVDPAYNQAIYQQVLQPNKEQSAIILQQATHGLLNATWFDYQLPSEWSLWSQGLFLLMGHHAYAPKALDTIGGWINNVTREAENR